MENKDYIEDISETKNVVNGIRSKNYGKIYLHSNHENTTMTEY